jgi:hypothetical protein
MSRPIEKNPAARRGTKALPVVGLVSVGLAVMVALLDHRLDSERDRSATLQGQVDRLEAERSALLAHVERQAASGRLGTLPGARVPGSPGTEAAGTPFQAASTDAAGLPTDAPRSPQYGAARDGAPGLAGGPAMGRMLDRASALHDPATRDALRREQSAAMHRRYPDLAQALGLSRENAERFIDLQVEQQMQKIDESLQFGAAGGGARSSAAMKEAGSRLAAAQRDADQAVAAQFGPEVLQQWKTYQQGLGARMELRGLQLELLDAGMALTTAQRDTLVAAMVREQQAGGLAGSKGLTAEARMAQAEASYGRLQDAARSVLGADQFARFDARQRQRLELTMAASDAARRRGPSP